jgi:hypothetical protein
MNLTELKQDLAKGVLISPYTWHNLLDHAIELERKLQERDNAPEQPKE